MSAGSLPRPTIFPSPDAVPFWEACRRRELSIPYCLACRHFFFYPRSICPACGSREVAWRRVTGRGRVYSFCIHHQSALRGFREAVPFVTAIIELDEGPRLMTFLTEIEPDPSLIQCNMPVEVAFINLDNGYLLPVFRPQQEPRA